MVHVRTIFYKMYHCENSRYIVIPNLIALICHIHGLPPINYMLSYAVASLTEMCLLYVLPPVIIQTPCLMATEYNEVSYGSQVKNAYFLNP
jgi:hypothetical protein